MIVRIRLEGYKRKELLGFWEAESRSSHILFRLNWYQWHFCPPLWASHIRGPTSGGLASQNSTIRKRKSSRKPEHAGTQQRQIFIVLFKRLWWRTPLTDKQCVQCQHFTLVNNFTLLLFLPVNDKRMNSPPFFHKECLWHKIPPSTSMQTKAGKDRQRVCCS